MPSGAWTSCHNEQSQEEDVGQPSISGSVRCTEVADGSIDQARQVAEQTSSHHLNELQLRQHSNWEHMSSINIRRSSIHRDPSSPLADRLPSLEFGCGVL